MKKKNATKALKNTKYRYRSYYYYYNNTDSRARYYSVRVAWWVRADPKPILALLRPCGNMAVVVVVVREVAVVGYNTMVWVVAKPLMALRRVWRGSKKYGRKTVKVLAERLRASIS